MQQAASAAEQYSKSEMAPVMLGGKRKRDSAIGIAEIGSTKCSGGGGTADTRSNSQLGSLLQLNNLAARCGGHQSDADELTIGYDPLECPDTPPIDTMSWSNMGIE